MLTRHSLGGGMNPEALHDGSLLVSLFVDQVTPDVNHFNQCSLGWHGKLVEEILIIAALG